jgi:nitrate/TMAO reductase-like tetraheme cytochrome c subunit
MRKLAALLVILAIILMNINLFAQEAKKTEASKFKYIGASKCKMCHKGEKKGNIFEKWQERGHSKAYATLATEESKEVAKKGGIKGDPQQAAECLVCHTTAYKAPAAQKEATLTMEEGVSCEACHGPGSEYKSMKVMKDIAAGKVKLCDYGLITPDKEVCVKCHNPKSPTYKEFKFEEAVKLIAHPLPKE